MTVAVMHEQLLILSSGSRVVPLGGGAYLRLDLAPNLPAASLLGSRSRLLRLMRGDAPPEHDDESVDDVQEGASHGEDTDTREGTHDAAQLAEAMERSARALRACARRWDAERVPVCSMSRGASVPPSERVRARIHAFLQALANSEHAVNAVVTLRRQVVASSHALTGEQRASIPFTIRRVDVEASRTKSSHGELVGDDFYALSFWFNACLVVFFSGPYAVDFVRHRARLVTRELAPLLAWLDEPPPASINVLPLPE